MSNETRIRISFAGKEYLLISSDNRLAMREPRHAKSTDITCMRPAKAFIAAICELEELQTTLFEASLNNTHPGQAGADELPTYVDIEGGKYTFRCDLAGQRLVMNRRIERRHEAWLDTDELENKTLWFTLAGALHNARRRAALIG